MSELNYHSTKFFTKNLLAIEMKKTEIFVNRPVYLGLSVLELSKIVIYDSWYDYIKPIYIYIYVYKEINVIWIQTVLVST